MRTQCPRCKQLLEADDQDSAHCVECPTCRHEFVLPAGAVPAGSRERPLAVHTSTYVTLCIAAVLFISASVVPILKLDRIYTVSYLDSPDAQMLWRTVNGIYPVANSNAAWFWTKVEVVRHGLPFAALERVRVFGDFPINPDLECTEIKGYYRVDIDHAYRDKLLEALEGNRAAQPLSDIRERICEETRAGGPVIRTVTVEAFSGKRMTATGEQHPAEPTEAPWEPHCWLQRIPAEVHAIVYNSKTKQVCFETGSSWHFFAAGAACDTVFGIVLLAAVGCIVEKFASKKHAADQPQPNRCDHEVAARLAMT